MEVKIRSRNGWLFAVVPKQRGLGRAVVRRLGTKSMEEARELVRHAGLEQMALAAKADAIGHDVWTRLLAQPARPLIVTVTLRWARDVHQ